MLTGFLIYDWIEKPHKQEVIKEVLSLLEQKILEPNSGAAHLAPPLFLYRVSFSKTFVTGFAPYFSHLLFSHTPYFLITQVSQKFVHFCVSKVILSQYCMASG